MATPFLFLRDISAPQHLNFTHTLIDKMINLETGEEFNKKVGNNQGQIKELIEELVRQEDIFKTAQLEYEKKEERYIRNTLSTEAQLDQLYVTNKLNFINIPREEILEALADEDLDYLVKLLNTTISKIKKICLICRKRTKFLIENWEITSTELISKLKVFEHLGLKQASNSLRLRLIPEITEIKSNLRENLIEGTMSRIEVLEKLDEFTNRVREDIFGDLTKSQMLMLENLNDQLSSKELVEYIINDNSRMDLIYLLQSDKIQIILKNPLNDLY